jgi:hypothetical protein
VSSCRWEGTGPTPCNNLLQSWQSGKLKATNLESLAAKTTIFSGLPQIERGQALEEIHSYKGDFLNSLYCCLSIGIGGGLFMVPIMVLVFRFKMHLAVGISAAMMVMTCLGG